MLRCWFWKLLIAIACCGAACTPLDPSGTRDSGSPDEGSQLRDFEAGVIQDMDSATRADVVTADSANGRDEGGPAQPGACNEEFSERCNGSAGQRQRCVGGLWVDAPSCAPGEVCSNEPKGGTCTLVSEVCRGNANQAICDGQGTMYQCNDQAVAAAQEQCASVQHCQMGLAARKCLSCLPGTFQCSGTALQRCNAEGTAFETFKTCATEALCNASVGDCTSVACVANGHTCSSDLLRRCNAGQTAYEDVKQCSAGLCDAANGQCDVCAPNSKTCEANTVVTCKADGQGVTREACPAETPFCVGLGRCVQCGGNADCGDPGTCKARHCNLATGLCEPQNQAARTPCAGGFCDGAGNCSTCLQNSDCSDPGECKTAFCNTSTHTCEPKNVGSGNRCSGNGYCNGSGSCVACLNASHCEAKACQTASCSSSGQCTYTPIAAGKTDALCALNQVCSGTGGCVDCVSDTHCKQPTGACLKAVCSSNQCITQNKTGACGTLKVCINGACVNSCGNGVLDPGTTENCEVGLSGHDSWSCDRQTCRTTGYNGSTLSMQCAADSDCSPNEVCDDTLYFGFKMCLPRCTAAGTAGSCTLPTGWTALPCGNRGCLVHCTTSGICPTGTSCSTNNAMGMCL